MIPVDRSPLFGVRSNVSPPLTSASLAGPYRFEITANDVALPGDVLRVPVFLAVEEQTRLWGGG